MRARDKSLADVLFGKARGAILGVLYGHPDESFYYRQLTRELNHVSAGTLQRELDTLSGLGLIDRSTIGNQVFYRANRNHPVYADLRALVGKTIGVTAQLRSTLSVLADRISFAFIYGSVARGEEKAGSDIDLMVVGTASLKAVLRETGKLEPILRRAINPTVYSPREFKTKLTHGNHFLESVVRKEKIFLIGDEDELSAVAGVRVAQS